MEDKRRHSRKQQCHWNGQAQDNRNEHRAREIKDKLKKAIKDGLSEDLEKDAENELQKLHDKYIKQLEALMAAKEKEIMTV